MHPTYPTPGRRDPRGRAFEDLHAGLASARLRELRAAQEPGGLGVRAFVETAHEADVTFRALPWWRRWGFGPRRFT